MAEQSFALYPLLNEINAAASKGAPLIAIAMTVALPDICVSLSSKDGRTTPDLYKKWCADNLGEEFSYLTPEDLWSMRCGVLHNGRYGDMKHNVARVIFAPPNPMGSIVNGQLNDAFFCSVVEFCKGFTEKVRLWCEKNKSSTLVMNNAQRLMQYRYNGFMPYISGITVLA